MTLDELEALARRAIGGDWFPDDHREKILARALLAILPVVRAAEEWRVADALYGQGRGNEVEGGIARSEQALADAIDSMRARLGGGG